MGRDQDLFNSRWPGVAKTVRLCQKVRTSSTGPTVRQNILSATRTPRTKLERLEVLVTVTAPAGTVHEAFFDPVVIGSGVGADASNGVLEPKAFRWAG